MDGLVRQFRSRLIAVGVSCCVLLACCGARDAVVASVPTDSPAHVVRLGREFKLSPGQQVSVKGTKLRIKFMVVKDDSRCPKDVTCVWAGNAAVRLWVTNGRGGKIVTVNTNKSPTLSDEAEYNGFKIKLVGLSPYPRSNHPITAGDYTATLLVSKE